MTNKPEKIRIFTQTPMVMRNDDLYTVESVPYNLRDLEKGKMYFIEDETQIYQGDVNDEGECRYTGFYTINYDRIVSHLEDGDSFNSMVDIVTHDVKSMLDKLSSIDIEDQMDVTMITDKNSPEIRDEDSGFDKVIKGAIIKKGINPKSYGSKLPKEHTIGNMITALRSDKCMSTMYFMNWLEVLGLDYELTIRDDGTDKYEMGDPITYDSRTGEIDV